MHEVAEHVTAVHGGFDGIKAVYRSFAPNQLSLSIS